MKNWESIQMELWRRFKEKLKRFYPVSLLRFNQRMEKAEEHLVRIQKRLHNNASALEELKENAQTQTEKLCQSLVDGSRFKGIFYCSPGEVNDIDTRGFYEARNSPDYLYRDTTLITEVE